MSKKKYCDKHSRIELENGKCIACGEIEYEPPQGFTLLQQIAIVIGTNVVFFSLVIIWVYIIAPSS